MADEAAKAVQAEDGPVLGRGLDACRRCRRLQDILVIGNVAELCVQAGTLASASALLGSCKALSRRLASWPELLPGIPIAIDRDVFIWHPIPGTLMALPGLMPRLFRGQAVAEVSGQIYRCGGRGPHRSFRSDLERFEQLAASWLSLQPMLSGRMLHSATALLGKLYICGGLRDLAQSAECFDPALQAWTQLPPMSSGRRGHGAAALRGKLYVCGGGIRRDVGGDGTVECFEPALGRWAQMRPMLRRNWPCRAAALRGNLCVVSVDDTDFQHPTVVAESFDPASSLWTELQHLTLTSSEEWLHTAAPWQGNLYVVFGPDLTATCTFMLRLNSCTEMWERVPLVCHELAP
mmetsp:Transcript_50861/g.110341  ORF Transcript_50861/g.110341 Transcript_50861/m.110341 type:complete len:349 (+) Transcript_50861:62-1108(+)|eukprot:CAMPEP_0170573170 /NCGR_PEP_ID=MMETSP0224-20130122/2621_1 /TAXON_ID=285029 /ORGANISM="Togula jolla, Strain CCCM 725" /LENGTH=348 /DNA_ID=CAMNT_0010895737 /DNA_START=57 /DNA_END=1103 /DNA_ORIENTATION=+